MNSNRDVQLDLFGDVAASEERHQRIADEQQAWRERFDRAEWRSPMPNTVSRHPRPRTVQRTVPQGPPCRWWFPVTAKILTRQICFTCNDRTRHEVLRRDDGSHIHDKLMLVCDNCGLVTTTPGR